MPFFEDFLFSLNLLTCLMCKDVGVLLCGTLGKKGEREREREREWREERESVLLVSVTSIKFGSEHTPY